MPDINNKIVFIIAVVNGFLGFSFCKFNHPLDVFCC